MTHLINNIYAVELPETAVDPWIMERYEDTMLGFYISDKIFGDENMMYSESIKLADHPNAYRLIGVWPGITEQQAGEVVECTQPKVRGAKVQMAFYKNYTHQFSSFPSASASFNSLMESKGLESGTWAIIEKI